MCIYIYQDFVQCFFNNPRMLQDFVYQTCFRCQIPCQECVKDFATSAYIVVSYEELLADVASKMGFKMS